VSGLSRVGLGTNNFGRRLDLDRSWAVIDAALESGVTHIDTAATYGGGDSERFIGKSLAGRRERAVVATKFGWGEERGGAPERVSGSLEGSLERLGMDYVDILYYHRPDGVTPISETVGAMHALVEHGVSADDIDIVWVPGAWELTGAARKLMTTDRYSAIVAVGAVIRGDTAHFEYVAGAATTGLAHASAEFDVPVGFGVLTCDTDAQAEERAGGAHGNKGWDAAVAALEMADLFDRLDAADEG